jgi:hypothetical protein
MLITRNAETADRQPKKSAQNPTPPNQYRTPSQIGRIIFQVATFLSIGILAFLGMRYWLMVPPPASPCPFGTAPKSWCEGARNNWASNPRFFPQIPDLLQEQHCGSCYGITAGIINSTPAPSLHSPPPSVVPESVPLTLPNMIGMSAEDASQTLRSLGFRHIHEVHKSSDQPKDTVIKQVPAAGVHLRLDRHITLMVAVIPSTPKPTSPTTQPLTRESSSDSGADSRFTTSYPSYSSSQPGPPSQPPTPSPCPFGTAAKSWCEGARNTWASNPRFFPEIPDSA